MENTEGTCAACRTVPVSYLHLDLSEPVLAWRHFLEKRGIEIVEDVSGRPSVPRWVLTKLLNEQRERETRLVAEAAERATRMTADVAVGVPALSDDASPFESLMAGDRSYVSPQDEFGRPRPDFMANELEHGARQAAAERAEIAARKGKDR